MTEATEITLAREDARGSDAEAMIGELVAYIEAAYPEDEEEPPPPWSPDDMVRNESFLIARVGGEAAGCGGFVPTALPGALEIVRMYVRPGFRGKRIGDRVLAALEVMARERGAGVLMLRCGPRQPEALRMYERNGFVQRGVFAHHRDHETNIFFEKRLGAP